MRRPKFPSGRFFRARREFLRWFSRRAYATGNIFEIERKFTSIYERNHWNSEESRSGTGSTLDATANIQKELPGLFVKYGVKTVFDAGCGDFNWMKHVLSNSDVHYTGGDTVRPLIKELSKFQSPKIRFVHFDLVNQIPPKADLMILRDVLFHLSYRDSRAVLENYLASRIPLLLTTTHDSASTGFENSDINTGHFRLIDLYSKPYSFSRTPLETLQDWRPPDPKRFLCLWDRPSVYRALQQWST